VDKVLSEMEKLARKLGMETFLEFDVRMLKPEARVRGFCTENKCGNYQVNYTCPPHVGSLDEIGEKLRGYSRGILLQYARDVDVRADRKAVTRAKVAFHRKILQLEDFLREQEISGAWGLSGGSCGLCRVCAAAKDEPCRFPDRARVSLEALGIDVLDLLDSLGMDNRFYTRRITWTGGILL